MEPTGFPTAEQWSRACRSALPFLIASVAIWRTQALGAYSEPVSGFLLVCACYPLTYLLPYVIVVLSPRSWRRRRADVPERTSENA